MKVIVTELPGASKDCIFAEYINMTSKYKCMFQSGMYSRCKLDCGEECPYLKRGAEEPSISVEQEIGELLDTEDDIGSIFEAMMLLPERKNNEDKK